MTETTGAIVPHQGGSFEKLSPGQLGHFDENRHDWNAVQSEAISLGGADLMDAELIDYLVKVPHTIVKVSFYLGKLVKNGHGGWFASHTAMIAPEDILAKKFRGNDKVSSWDQLPFDPEDIVVYNDGGTGLYRQDVKVLHNHGYIGLPDPVIENGGVGESTYDLGPDQWTGIDPNRARITRDETGAVTGVEFAIRIDARRGIRYSEYEGPNGASRTRYVG